MTIENKEQYEGRMIEQVVLPQVTAEMDGFVYICPCQLSLDLSHHGKFVKSK